MATPAARRILAQCPGCNNDIAFYKVPKLGEFVTCSECGDLVEVVNLSPLTLDWSADIDDEDWLEDLDDMDNSEEFDDYEDWDDSEDF
jgi:lysine biosynthesis protein LysW